MATAVLGFEGFSAFLVSVAVVLFCLLILTLLSRLVRGQRRQQKLRAVSEVDQDGNYLHLHEQTEALKRLTGIAVGFLVGPAELANAKDNDLVGPVGVATQLRESVTEYQQCFGDDPMALQQAQASLAVEQQVRDLYYEQLRARGWSDQRIQRSAQSAVRMARMVNRRRRQS